MEVYLIWNSNSQRGRIAFNKEDARTYYRRVRKVAMKSEVSVYLLTPENVDSRGFVRSKGDRTWDFAE